MSKPRWLAIQYRDFYDIPRLVVVSYGGQLYLFDSPFDDDADEYSDHFTVYRLRPEAGARIEDASWLELVRLGEPIGRVRTDEVEFDPSKRHLISDAVFRRLGVE